MIGGLRLLSGIDWREFVESVSAVDDLLRQDPTGTYGGMEFATRDRYRHAVERIARGCGRAEADVATMALAHARAAVAAGGRSDRAAHVGHHLIGSGVAELERAAGI